MNQLEGAPAAVTRDEASRRRPASAPIRAPGSQTTLPSRSARNRLRTAALAGWAALTGIAPHVLHHVGPLAGAAFLAGAGGRILFAGIAFVVSVPFLLRIRRRFANWIAPAIALAVMAGTFSVSTLVIGPLISGDSSRVEIEIDQPGVDEHGH